MLGGIALAIAQSKTSEPDVIAHHTLMDGNGIRMGVLGDMAKGDEAFDAVTVETARPDVWTHREEFVADADNLGKAAAALDTTSLNGIQAKLRAIGTCKDCHTASKVS